MRSRTHSQGTFPRDDLVSVERSLRKGDEVMRYGFPMILPVISERIYLKLTWLHDLVQSKFLCWLWGIGSGKKVSFSGKTYIRCHHKGDIQIGNGTVFNACSRTNSVGLSNPTILDTRMGGKIVIGEQCGFSSPVIVSKSLVSIGSHVLVGGNVRIFDHDFHAVEWQNRRPPENRAAVRTRPVVIEGDVFIGTNAIILKGSRIGARSLVAAGSVVFGLDVPPDSLVKGNPAVIVPRTEAISHA